jgi:RNA polymerase II transcription elongation factor
VFKGPLQETKSNEFVLIYDPETNSFVLDRLSSISRLAATRGSRANTFNGAPSYVHSPADQIRNRSRSNEDVPRISLDSAKETTVDEVDETPLPTLVTPRLPPSSPPSTRTTRKQEIVSSDDDSDIDIGGPSAKAPQQDDDVSDEDLDDLANELESSLENRPGSSSEDVDDSDGPPRGGAKPDFGNVPRSGGPISMSSRFAGARRRAEEEESSSSDDDDD